MATGFVKKVIESKSYGFISTGDGDDYFFHSSQIADKALEFGELMTERAVTFDIATDERSGKLRAINVRAAT